MARQLKPLLVETITHPKTRQQVELYFDRNEKRFYADVMLKRVEANSAYECQKLIENELAAYKSPEWRRVIWLKLDPLGDGGYGSYGSGYSTRHGCELEFAFERIEIGKKPNGENVKRPFAEDLDDDRERKRQIDNELSFAGNIWDEDIARTIPYSDAAWSVLTELEEVTKRAHAKLTEMFSTKDGGKRLLAM